MISLTRGALAVFYKEAGNHNVSFEVEIPDSPLFIGIRHPAYGQKGTPAGTPFIAVINPNAPDPAAKVVTQIADLHTGHEAVMFFSVVGTLLTSHEQRSPQGWVDFLSSKLETEVKVNNYGG